MSRDAWEPMWVMLRNVAERHRPGHGQLVRQMRVERRNEDAVIVAPPPPYSSGTSAPRYPAAVRAWTNSVG